ncbi:MAG: cupin domain-containing protein [Anaerolineae bacterium]|nr:cupin domain-containing protein [Anaerolineae bacterium]
MIVRRNQIEATGGRRPYPLGETRVEVAHWVERVTTPENPFGPHAHEKPELWYIVSGQAIVSMDGTDHLVEAGDLIVIEPWAEHGLRVEREATWLCLG